MTGSFLDEQRFTILCEIEPCRSPELDGVRRQIDALAPIADAFLVPDSHLGVACVSSIAVAHEVSRAGGTPVACVNARDRNLLGFRRDLLTAAAYGVDHFLFVYGDRPKEGTSVGDLTVRGMLQEIRSFGTGALFEGRPTFRVGVVAKPRKPLEAWRTAADFAVTQISFDLERLFKWRRSNPTPPAYAGVLVLASARMARRVSATIPGVTVPDRIVRELERNADFGLDLAMEQLDELERSNLFEGAHLVPATRYEATARRLKER